MKGAARLEGEVNPPHFAQPLDIVAAQALEEDGVVVLGKGADQDIFTASAKAYINGLNRLEYLKKNPSLNADERRL